MSWEVARAALDLILEHGPSYPELSFYGGEPLMARETFERAVDYVENHHRCDQKPRFRITTNGLLVDTDVVEYLADHGIQTSISCDGVFEAQERRGRGSFRGLDRLFAQLRSDHIEFTSRLLTFRLTLDSSNVAFFGDSIRYLLRYGAQRIAVAPVVTHDPGWGPDQAAELDRQLGLVTRDCVGHFERTGSVPLTLLREPRHRRPGRGTGIPMCAAGNVANLTVDTDGALGVCSALVESAWESPPPLLRSEIERLEVGRIGTVDLHDRLADVRRRWLGSPLFHNKERKRSDGLDCADCRWLSTCLVCPVSICHIPGNEDPHRVPALPCDFNILTSIHRERFRESLELNAE
jgi:hypothetical protein